MGNMRAVPFLFIVFVLSISSVCLAAGVVPLGVTALIDSASSNNPAAWWLDADYDTVATESFKIGSWNQLNIDDNYVFTANNDLIVGISNNNYSSLSIKTDSRLLANANVYCGQSISVSQYSRNHKIIVDGHGAKLDVVGNLNIGSGGAWLVNDNVLNISNGGIVTVEGNFSVANHWAYGNSWLELNGGMLALAGDRTNNFGSASSILSSIKLWDDINESWQRVAYYQSTTFLLTQYYDLLAVEFVQDSQQASFLGLSDDFIGFTVVYNVPEPATILLFSLGAISCSRRFRRQ